MRYHVQPGDVPPKEAAKRLGIDAREFEASLPRLIARGFPKPDPDTGNFDLDAIDAWRRSRNPHLFGLALSSARDANTVAGDRIAAMRAGRG